MAKKPKKIKVHEKVKMQTKKAKPVTPQELAELKMLFGAYVEEDDAEQPIREVITSIAIRQAKDLNAINKLGHALNRAVTDFINNCPRAMKPGLAGVDLPRNAVGGEISVSPVRALALSQRMDSVDPVRLRVVTARPPKRRR